MTSVAFSPALGHWVGLGLLAGGASRHGERVRAYDPVRSGDELVEVCDPVFYDPGGGAAAWLRRSSDPCRRSMAPSLPAATAIARAMWA